MILLRQNAKLFALMPCVGLYPQCEHFALPISTFWYLRYWSLITGRGGGGGYKTGGGRGAHEVLPLRKGGGAEKVLAMLKGGTRSFGVVFML